MNINPVTAAVRLWNISRIIPVNRYTNRRSSGVRRVQYTRYTQWRGEDGFILFFLFFFLVSSMHSALECVGY